MSEPSFSSEPYAPDRLIAGDSDRITRSVTLTNLGAAGALLRGAVLGRVTKGAASILADGGNTGNGTAGAITRGAQAIVGDYTVECVEAATNAGRFKVIDPNGNRLDDLTVAVAYSNGHFGVTIADGGTDFAVGDTFTVTIAAGSGSFGLSAAAATDGSADPVAILAKDADPSSGDVAASIFENGEFNQDRLSFGTGHTASTVREALRAVGIHLKDPLSA